MAKGIGGTPETSSNCRNKSMKNCRLGKVSGPMPEQNLQRWSGPSSNATGGVLMVRARRDGSIIERSRNIFVVFRLFLDIRDGGALLFFCRLHFW